MLCPMPLTLRLRSYLNPGEAYQLLHVRSDVNILPGEHTHDYAEIFWLTAGHCRHVVKGVSASLPAGVVFILRPGDAHQLQPIETVRFSFTNLIFDPALARELSRRHPEPFARFFDLRGKQPPRFTLRSAALEELNRHADRLLEGPPDAFLLEWFLYALAELAGLHARGAAWPPDVPDWLVEATARIREPEWFVQGVQGFVKAAGHGHEHVCRSAKRYLGKTPVQIVNEARLNFARRQLLTTGQPVGQIAEACGFANPTQFHALFRAATGLTPLQYRKRSCQPI